MKKIERIEKAITDMGFHPFRNCDSDDNQIRVSMEHGDDAGNFYDSHLYGDFGINQKLNDLAEKHNSYWEWEHPGAISMYID
jgi:hypothetical protein